MELLQDQAELYLRQGRYGQARALYQQLSENSPDQINYHWSLGLCALLEHQVLEAQWIWQMAIAAAEAGEWVAVADLKHWLHDQATQRLNRGDRPQAEMILEQLLELGERQVEIYMSLGSIRMEAREFHSAIEMWHQVLKLDPDQGKAHHQLGLCLKKLGQIPEANRCFQRSAELDPTWSDPLLELGHCLIHQGELERARAYLVRGIELSATAPDLHSLLADLRLRVGDVDGAIRAWRQAVQQDRIFFEALCRFAPGNTQLFHLLLQTDPTTETNLILRQEIVSIAASASAAVMPTQAKAAPSPPQSPRARPRPDLLPIGGYEQSLEGLQQTTTGQVISIHPGHQILPRAPHSQDPEILTRFREIQITSPATFVALLSQGRAHVHPYPRSPYADYGSAILTADHLLLADLSPCLPTPRYIDRPYLPALLQQHPILSLQSLPDPQILLGSALVLPLGAMNYFHWMVDILPSLALVQSAHLSMETCDHILLHGYKGSAFQDLTLGRLGIPPHKIINTADPQFCHCQADQLIVPSLAGHISHLTFWGAEFLRDLFLKDQSPATVRTKRIYISRQGCKWRRVINEAEVMDLLRPLGFESIRLEQLTLVEQATLMAAAEVVISVHGAGLTNIVFCEPGTKVIEIFPRDNILPYFWMIAQHRDLHYFAGLGESCKSSLLCQILQHPQLDQEDILVDPNKLKILLESAEIL